jgi:hypothetical protein
MLTITEDLSDGSKEVRQEVKAERNSWALCMVVFVRLFVYMPICSLLQKLYQTLVRRLVKK